MSHTLETLIQAEAALDQGDYAEAKARIKYLRQRMETLLGHRKNFTETAREQHSDEKLADRSEV